MDFARPEREARSALARARDEHGIENSYDFVLGVVSQSRDVIIVADEAGTIVFIAGALEELSGWTAEELIGTDGLHLIHPEDFESFGAHLERLLTNPKEPSTTEARVRRSDGTLIWIEVVAINLFDDPKVRGLVGHFREITDRKEAEARQAASEARFRALVQNGFDLVAITGRDGKLTYVSPSCEAVLGYSQALLMQEGPKVLFGDHPDSILHRLDVEPLARALATIADAPGSSERIRCRFRDTSGRWRWFECVFSNQLHVPGVDGFVSNCREITEQIAAIDALTEWEARFRALVRHSSDLILVVDSTGAPTYVSPSLEHVLGFRAQQVMGVEPVNLVPSMAVETWTKCYEAAIAQPGVEQTSVLKTRHADGRILDVEVRATCLLDDPDVRGVVFHVRDVTAQRMAQDELERRALHDSLTDLPNRALLWDRLTHALAGSARRATSPAVLFVDLDHFKQVNDSLGHDVGDQLLVEVAVRLGEGRRQSDTVARLGGDEFVIVLEDVATEREAQDVAQRILASLRRPFRLGPDGLALNVAASIGLAFASRCADCTAETIIRAADAAMYNAKRLGGDRLELFDAG